MKKLWSAIVIGSVLALAACSTAPPPPPRPQIAQPTFTPPPTEYRWTQGNAAKGFEAMAGAFGRMTLRPAEFLWAPVIPAEGETRLVVDIANQIAFVYRADQLIGVTNVSSGKKGHPTPLGFWSVQFKRPMYRSKKYDNAAMPFMQSIDDHGIAFHAGVTPGFPASHGCIRMPPKFAQRLYGLTKVGDKVIIEG
ncbi:MAG: L,D-transpeptidase family protein [Sphingomonas sp.]|uniref:L,D-transpeptidase family protein n=1 Tax=Sphingomonas sp. TaxID=28214 RepID=UPI0017A3CD23|nr:L,D-transpeptidase family protein [Sphingomonas sp.]MBA3666374.1 L,D-transpeptidase family protein [Sphingomonas sp.]